MAKHNNSNQKPKQVPSKPKHDANRGRTTPKPPIRPKK